MSVSMSVMRFSPWLRLAASLSEAHHRPSLDYSLSSSSSSALLLTTVPSSFHLAVDLARLVDRHWAPRSGCKHRCAAEGTKCFSIDVTDVGGTRDAQMHSASSDSVCEPCVLSDVKAVALGPSPPFSFPLLVLVLLLSSSGTTQPTFDSTPVLDAWLQRSFSEHNSHLAQVRRGASSCEQ